MQIILLEKVTNLGGLGDVVKVRDGFARNFLLPQKKALRASKENMERFEMQRTQLEARDLELKKDAQAVAEKLKGAVFLADRHSLLLSGELRWIPNRMAVDMAVFYDMGKVASRWDGLSLDGLKSNVCIGVRFHGPFTTPLRIELARGREGLNLVFSGSAAF